MDPRRVHLYWLGDVMDTYCFFFDRLGKRTCLYALCGTLESRAKSLRFCLAQTCAFLFYVKVDQHLVEDLHHTTDLMHRRSMATH